MAKKGQYIYEWPRPMVTTDALVFAYENDRPQILLIKRGNEPFKDKWAIPGGFVEMDEDLQESAARELEEETSITNVSLTQLKTFGKPGRDPRGRQITIAFFGVIKTDKPSPKGGDDAAEAQWFFADELPKLAFDHEEIVNFAIKKLKKDGIL